MLNTMRDAQAFKDLIAGGGRPTVPCLRIDHSHGESQWLYESLDIIEFIHAHEEELVNC